MLLKSQCEIYVVSKIIEWFELYHSYCDLVLKLTSKVSIKKILFWFWHKCQSFAFKLFKFFCIIKCFGKSKLKVLKQRFCFYKAIEIGLTPFGFIKQRLSQF